MPSKMENMESRRKMRNRFLIVIMVLLVSFTLFLIYQNPDETPESLALEKHSDEIVQVNEESKIYQSINDEQNFNKSKISMQEKIKEVSMKYMGLKVSHVELLDGQYPFWSAHDRIEKFDWVSSICDFEQDIPLHMQRISQTDNLQKFAKKYSSYPIELIIMDERNDISNIHYGLMATNKENQHASTYFHLDSCTNEITDKTPYFLNCSDKSNDYQFTTFNYNDVISSYSNAHFCKIELDPWRQSLYEYSKTLQEKRRQLEKESIEGIVDQESHWMSISAMNKLGDLGNLVGFMVHGNFDDSYIQEKINEYERRYGSLPEELIELIKNRK